MKQEINLCGLCRQMVKNILCYCYHPPPSSLYIKLMLTLHTCSKVDRKQTFISNNKRLWPSNMQPSGNSLIRIFDIQLWCHSDILSGWWLMKMSTGTHSLRIQRNYPLRFISCWWKGLTYYCINPYFYPFASVSLICNLSCLFELWLLFLWLR